MAFKYLPYLSVEQSLHKMGRSLYPFSWPLENTLLYTKKIKGDLFNTEGDVETVESIKTKEIKKVIENIQWLKTNDIPREDEDGEPVWDDLSNSSINVSIVYSRLVKDPQNEIPYIERASLPKKLETRDHIKMTYLKHILIFSHIKSLFLDGAWNDRIRIHCTDIDAMDSLLFNKSTGALDNLDNLDRVLLNGRYLSYSKGLTGVSLWELPVGVHPIDLQTYINSLLTHSERSWDLGIEKAFDFLSPKKPEFSNNDIITPFLQNIEQTPKLERMPLDQSLTQFFQHYAGFSLELTQTESLYAKIKTEFDPGKIASLTKPDLIDEVTKFLNYLGFKIMAQHDVKKALEEDPSLEGKILLKNDPEAIATLLFNPSKKMGGARSKQKTQDSEMDQESLTS